MYHIHNKMRVSESMFYFESTANDHIALSPSDAKLS
jgi:hypothetical protein